MTQSESTQGEGALGRGDWVDGWCLGRWVLPEPGARPAPGRRGPETGLHLAQRPTRPMESYRKGARNQCGQSQPLGLAEGLPRGKSWRREE